MPRPWHRCNGRHWRCPMEGLTLPGDLRGIWWGFGCVRGGSGGGEGEGTGSDMWIKLISNLNKKSTKKQKRNIDERKTISNIPSSLKTIDKRIPVTGRYISGCLEIYPGYLYESICFLMYQAYCNSGLLTSTSCWHFPICHVRNPSAVLNV